MTWVRQASPRWRRIVPRCPPRLLPDARAPAPVYGRPGCHGG